MTTAIRPISDTTWATAQQAEHTFWQSQDRTGMARELDLMYMQLLGITREGVTGLSVLDIGGGPYPIGALFQLPLALYVVVDPLPPVDPPFRVDLNMLRVQMAAEDYVGPPCDEVWGYNVLQHVIDPAAVLETAKLHALKTIRWFDWVDTPIESHHPHSLEADWLREQFADWRIVSDIRDSIPVGLSHPQSYVAIVAERI